MKGDYDEIQLLNVNWESFFVGCMGNIGLLWEDFHQKFKAVEQGYLPTNQVRSGNDQTTYFGQNISQETQKELLFMETISRNKGPRVNRKSIEIVAKIEAQEKLLTSGEEYCVACEIGIVKRFGTISTVKQSWDRIYLMMRKRM